MPKPRTRRQLLKEIGAVGGASIVAGRVFAQPVVAPAAADGAILPHTSTSGVFVPPRGRGFQKFSFDFPEPSVAFGGFEFGARVFTHENVYALDGARLRAAPIDGGLEVSCDGFVWAGGQQRSGGRLVARLTRRADSIECVATAGMDRPLKSLAIVVRGVPRGRISPAGAPYFDPHDDEVLLGYPFSGGDLFGPQGNGGLTTPLVLIDAPGGVCAISWRDDRMRTKRFYLQPGDQGYRVEALVEAEAWSPAETLQTPRLVITPATSVGAAAAAHYAHLETAFHLPPWRARPDVPEWMRGTALVVTLHGMHYTGYVFNDYARMLQILQWIAARIPASRVLAFFASWDGRYYWDYPLYRPPARLGGDAGFRALIDGARSLGIKTMPMFGANAANRHQPAFAGVADAVTTKLDGDRLDLNWVDWDNDRHQDGWLSYMNLGVESWRRWLEERIADIVQRYGVDAYFLDIAGGWINDPKGDMHAGMRRLIADLRRRFPTVAAVGEMHYDALVEFIPLYHSFGQTLVADVVQRHARFFQHLSHPAPGRGSTGVHEAGFGRWNPQTLSLSDAAIPTLNIVDDTFEKYRDEMEAVIREARARASI